MYENFYPWVNPMHTPNPMMMECNDNPNIRLTRAYIPAQPYIGTFPLDEALKKGMLFPNLYVPYPIKSMK